MYSRNLRGDERYRENLPPVYGGSRFYRGGVKTPEGEPSAPLPPEEGIEVLYEARPLPEKEETPAPCPPPAAEPEGMPKPEVREKKEKREGCLPALFQDPEEILLLALLFLLSAEGDHAVDVIVILLLLTVVR